MKNYFKIWIIIGIFLLISNCERGESIDIQQPPFETASINEVLDFFKYKKNSLKSYNEKYSEIYVIPNLENITQEEIINSSELLTVVSASTIHEKHYSRILFFKINKKIKSVVFSMYPSQETKNENFSGEILITDLDGIFLSGFRCLNGKIISQFIKKNNVNKTSISLKNSGSLCPEHGACYEGSYCNFCLQSLEEITINARYSHNNIDVQYFITVKADGEGGGGGGFWDSEVLWSFSSGNDSNDNCPENKAKDYFGNCVCADGYIEDDYGICVEDINVEEQSITRICGEYEFKQIGNANYANITNLHLGIIVTGIFTNNIINVEFNEICISVPYLSSIAATNAFNTAYENAKIDLYNAMSGNPSLINDVEATISFKGFLLDRLADEQPGSSLSTMPCGNDVPTSEAQYCI